MGDEKNGSIMAASIAVERNYRAFPFRFKFVSDDGEWLEPFCEFPSVKQDSNGVFNYLFDQRRTGSDVLVFEMVEEERNSNLKRWIKYRPEGKFGFLGILTDWVSFVFLLPERKKSIY